jgi:formate hydrogenlyase subunit 6/NADH:ubiquinone oxidoreductase subunit I/flavodoxin
MAKPEVYYFSSTGNSLAVAGDMAKGIDGNCISFVSVKNQENINTEADCIGLVFPLYDFKYPRIVEECVQKMEDLSSKYIFAVCTYAIAPAHSLIQLQQIIESQGGKLAGGFAVKMPHSGIASASIGSVEKDRLLFEKWELRKINIINYVMEHMEGTVETSAPALNLFKPEMVKAFPTLFTFLKIALFKGFHALDYTAGEECNGCGICEKVCPVGNITMDKDRPLWGGHCMNCFACYHWCPKNSISLGGYDMNIRRYHHPSASLTDILNQKTPK